MRRPYQSPSRTVSKGVNNKTRTPVAGRRPRARSSVNPPSDEFIDDSTTPTDNERAPGPPHAPDAPIQAQHELGSSAAAARSGHGREPLDPADIAAAQLRGVLDGLPDGVMLLDGVGRVTALNRIAAGLLGLAV